MAIKLPQNLVVRKMFAAMLSAAGALLHENYRGGEQIQILIFDGNGLTVQVSTYRSLSEVPINLYVGPLKPTKDWRCLLALLEWTGGGTVIRTRPVTLQVEARNGLTWKRFKVQNKRAVKLSRRRLHVLKQRHWMAEGRRFKTKPQRLNPEVIKTNLVKYFENASDGVRWFTNVQINGFVRYWTGTRTPNFWALKPRNRPFNDHTVLQIRVSDGQELFAIMNGPPANFYFELDTCTYMSSLHACAVPGQAVHDSLLWNRSVSRLRDKANVQTSNIAQDLLLVNEITRMTVDTVGRVISCLRALSGHNFDMARRALERPRRVTAKNHRGVEGYTVSDPAIYRKYLVRLNNSRPSSKKSLADNWLEMQYGWKPLLADIHDVVEKLADANLADVAVQRVTASASSDIRDRRPITDSRIPSGTVIGYRSSRKVSKCKIVTEFRVDDHLLAFLAQTGFTNPVNLAWEILPWSFVVDWFLPIGQFFEGLTSWQGLTFLRGSKTSFTRETTSICTDYLGPGKPPNAPGSDIRILGSLFCEAVRLDRVKLTSFPMSTLPTYKNPFSCVHGLNAIALLKTSFSSLGRTYLNK